MATARERTIWRRCADAWRAEFLREVGEGMGFDDVYDLVPS
jgi:hypothetical protein